MITTARKQIRVSGLLGAPLLLVMAVLAIPSALVTSLRNAVRERRLFRRLRDSHRTLPWCEVERHLQLGFGTLIIEQAQKQGHRLWWTPDDVSSVSPIPIPAFADIDFVTFDPAAPFTLWCFERYLSTTSGSGFLTRSLGLPFPPGFIEPDFILARFPSARVIATILTH